MRVLINAVAAKSGGFAVQMTNLAYSLAELGPKHRYLFCVPEKLGGRLAALAEHVEVLSTDISFRAPWKRFLWDQVVLRRLAKQWQADVLLAPSEFALFFAPVPQVLIVQNPLFFSQLYLETILPHKSVSFRSTFMLRRWLIRLSIRHSDVVMTPSQSMVEDLRRLIPYVDSRSMVNAFGVRLDQFRPRSMAADIAEAREGVFNLLFVSEYGDYKDLTTLLQAVPLLSQNSIGDFQLATTADPGQFPGVHAVKRALDQALESDPAVARHVRFVGAVPYEGIESLYQQADVFVFPSLAESFGHPLAEAMACGLPIVASDIPICREICGDAAVYFKPSSPADLCEKVVRLWQDRELRVKLGQLGRARAEAHYDWNAHVRRLLGVLEGLAEKARRAGIGRPGDTVGSEIGKESG